jgi:hypothetical protein
MFNTPIVTTGLLGQVGYRQPLDPGFPILDEDNLTSKSGLIVNDNSFAKLEYLHDGQDYKDINTAQFNTYLKNKQKQSIVNVCNAVFNQSGYIDKQILFKNAFNKVDTETLPDGFVGFRIRVDSKKNIAFKIKRILLDFEGSGDIELLLFNTSQKDPLLSKVITIGSDHENITLDWVSDNSGDTYKGDYYLGYLTNYVGIGTLKPYDKDHNAGNIMSVITHLFIDRGVFPGMSANILPDLDDWDGMSETTGLNPDITVYDDFTELIINNDFLFANAINYDMQINVLSEIGSSIRSNRNTRVGKDMLSRIQLEIEGQSEAQGIKVTGLRPQLYKSLGILKKEIDSLQKGYFGERAYIETMV